MRLRFNKTQSSAVNQVMGFDMLSAHGDVVTDMAQIRGSRYTGGGSLDRHLELNNIQTYTEASLEDRQAYDTALNQYGKKRLARHGSGRYGVKNLPFGSKHIEENYPGFNDEVRMIEPEEANEKYGLDGRLKFTEPVSNLEAYVLNERKQQEVKFNFALDKAYGSQFVKGMGIEMGMALLDPVTIPLMFIPPIGGAKVVAALGMTGSRVGTRAITGGMAGFYGSVALEPLIYSAASREQADYGAIQSFFNIAFGTIAGGGLHTLGGAIVDGVRHIKAKRNLAAFDTAVKQTAEGKTVEVSPIAHGSDEPVFKPVESDLDEVNSGKPGSQPSQPNQKIKIADSEEPVNQNKTREYKPHNNADESMTLIRQNEKGMALSGVKFKNALEGSQEYKAAVAEADKLKVKQKLAFRIKTKEGSFIFIRAKEGESLRLFDTDSFGPKTMDELNKIDSKAANQAVGELVHQSLLMHGVNVAEANVKYTGSTKLQEDAVHHVIDIFDAEFNPKMNQNDVVIAPPHEAASLFKGDPVISLFSQEIKAGKDAILQQYSKFDEGAFLNDTQGQKPYFDEQLLNDNLQQTGKQAGTQKGGFYKDAATGENFYVKYPENVELAKNEFIAASIYRELGVPFPLTKLVGDSKGNIIGVASKIVPGSKMITPDEFIKLPEAARNKFAENALIDMYLGNWDVVGNFPNYNLLLTPDGTVVRIDPGGALIFRAQGEPKNLSNTVDEMQSFLNANKYAATAKVFKSIEPAKLEELHAKAAAKIFSTPESALNDIIDIVAPTAKNAKLMKTKLANRRAALAEVFGKVEQRAVTKQGTIAANSFSAAQKALDKMNTQGKLKLTAEESTAIKEYTQTGHGWMNAFLRRNLSPEKMEYYAKMISVNGKKFKQGEDAVAHLNSYVKLLDSAMQKTKLNKPLRVFRGGVPKEVFNKVKNLELVDGNDIHTAGAMVGGELKLMGYTSTSLQRTKAFGFGNYPSNTRLQINVPKGMPLLYSGKGKSWSYGTNESEIILPHGLNYVIKKATQTDKAGVVIELDALLPGEKLVPKINQTQQIKIAERYKVQKSNAVSDIDPDDPDIKIDSDNIKADLTPNKPKELAASEQELEELKDLIAAEMANADPKYVKNLTKEIEDFNAKADQDIADAQDLYKAAKAAAVCIRGVG